MSRCARPHVPEEELHAWLDRALSPAQSAEIAEHLMGCLLCRAAHGDVVATRDRAAAILAVAAPRATRRAAARSAGSPWRQRRRAAGVAAALLVGGGWLANQPASLALPSPRLATLAFVAPALHAQVRDGTRAGLLPRGDDPSALHPALRGRLVTRATMTTVRQPSLPLAPAADVDPALGWETISWDEALLVAGGSLARLDGLPITAVRIQRNGAGTRPTFFVKQRLPDGRAVWVVEGPEDRVEPVHAAIEASGLTSSIALRTRPDYAGTEEAPVRTLRLVTIAASLEKDAVDGLLGRLRLD